MAMKVKLGVKKFFFSVRTSLYMEWAEKWKRWSYAGSGHSSLNHVGIYVRLIIALSNGEPCLG